MSTIATVVNVSATVSRLCAFAKRTLRADAARHANAASTAAPTHSVIASETGAAFDVPITTHPLPPLHGSALRCRVVPDERSARRDHCPALGKYPAHIGSFHCPSR